MLEPMGDASNDLKPQIDVAAAMSEACSAHQTGELDRAERGYRSVLAAQKNHPDALHLLGLIAYQRGEGKLAVSLVEKAIAVSPDNADFHFNLGKIHKLQGQPDLAIPCYERAYRLAPNNPGTLLNLGNCWRARGSLKRAERCYRLALKLDESHIAALNNLGTLCRGDGRFDEAVSFYERALALKDGSPQIWENLAKTLTDAQRLEEAARAYRRALELDPKRETAIHMLAAIEGRTPDGAPDAYVRALFDDYAPRFEQHLVKDLGYSLPSQIRALLNRDFPGADPVFSRALDLGCGTGLVGAAVRDRVGWLAGVDISGKMLQQAEEKAVYDSLDEAEVVAFLDATSESWDLILAADVLIYVGALDAILPAIRKRLNPTGRVILSVERHGEDEGYRLRSSGRFAHSEAYVMAQADKAGLAVTSCRELPLRKNGEEILTGLLISLTTA